LQTSQKSSFPSARSTFDSSRVTLACATSDSLLTALRESASAIRSSMPARSISFALDFLLDRGLLGVVRLRLGFGSGSLSLGRSARASCLRIRLNYNY
jgi:hypothetical protein